ncbi:cytochrome P450 [Xylaria venustula]|nr:cytochrome P450 [Xylaria venustula]
MILVPIIIPLATSVLLSFILALLGKVGQRRRGCPPGPPTLPLIGNIHQFPKTKLHLQYQRWAQQYGPVYSLVVGTRTIIVLSSGEAVKQLLDKRNSIYSSRPESYLGQAIMSGGLRVMFMPTDKTWRMVHKLGNHLFNIKTSKSYLPYQDLETKAMLLGFLHSQDRFIEHIQCSTASLVTQMTYGFRMTLSDTKLKLLFQLLRNFSEMTGSRATFLLDFFPVLRLLPDMLLPPRRRGKLYHAKEHKMFIEQYLETKRLISQSAAQPCVCADLVKLQEQEGCSDDLAAYMAGSLIQAGSETMSSTLIGFVQAMVIFPAVARAAQKELDEVCGDRIPNIGNELPYIRCCIKETLRWMPTVPLGVPHRVTCDDEYMGYSIPKDSAVILNVWAIHNHPERYPNPRQFDPDRWCNDSQTSAKAARNPDENMRDHFTFGAGRRLCQGMHIVDNSLFLAIARLLWAFNFGKAVDKETNLEITPDTTDLVDGLIVRPNAFKANITPRTGKAVRIQEEWALMQEVLGPDLQWKHAPEGSVCGR